MQRLIQLTVRGSMVWGRWAARHPRVARLVYVAECAALGVIYWLLFGIRAGVIAAALMFVFLNVFVGYVRLIRRKRGLPPLPSIWRSKSK